MTTEGSSFGQPNIPKFDGDHDHWSLLMENLLRSKEYWIVVENGIPEEGENQTPAQKKNLEDMKLKDLKAKNYLFSSIDNYFGRVLAVAIEMRNYGETMEDVKIVEKILRTLTDKWNFVVCSIEESKDVDEMTVDELQSSLLVHEQKFKRSHDDEDIQALKVTFDDSRETNYAVVNNNEWEEEREMLLMAYTSEVMKRGDGWFLDSGCSNHISGDRSWFITLDQNHSTTVKLGNNMVMKTAGQCNIKIRLNGVNHIVPDVYCVPELRNNLLSMGQLQERANSSAKEENCLITKGKDLSQLWHRRLGHLSYIMLKQLGSKHHREPFPSKSTWRANKLLELVHADLCGPISPASNGDKRYNLCFIDDFSRKGWVYFLTEKSEAFYYFKCFKKLVEKQTGFSLKCLRTDRGGEFNSTAFNEMCKENGIQRQLTASYTPQQNGVSERKNRTLLNMARAVLSDQGMPKCFWAEAVNWSNYVLNRCPNAALKDITPEEAWSGNRPSISHMRVFGCLANVHIPKQQRTKLDDRSVECVFLGFIDESKACKLLNPKTNKIIVSRDVIFQEDKGWDWSKTHLEDGLIDLEWDDEVNSNSNNEGDDVAVIPEEEDVIATNEEDVSVMNNTHHERVNTRSGRSVQAPVWMNDYVSGNELEDVELNLSMAENSDPVSVGIYKSS
nr:hypothetical protein [Tanacetum cinerariifolium]